MNKQITRKRIWSLMMAIVFMFAAMIPVFAAETEITLSGQGTSQDPYLIGTEAELCAFREAVHTDAIANSNVSSLCAKLTADIALTKVWYAIAGPDKLCQYGGTIDGDGHTISGMSAGRKDVMGLVGEAADGLVIKNLTLEGNFDLAGQHYSAGFVGRAHGNITFENCVNKVNVTGADRICGFIGDSQLSYSHSFINCANYGKIAGTTNVSGFVGAGAALGNTFTNCVNYGAISANTGSVVAGISPAGTYTNCIGYGSVTNSGPATAIYNAWGGAAISGSNCYYRSGVVTGDLTPNPGTAKTTAQFASGELTYLLNGNSSENITWGQDLENEPYPVYGKTDYPVYYIEEQGTYSNKNEVVGTENNPYLIGTAEQLAAFRDLVNNGGTTLCAKLTADITLTGIWNSISPVNTANKYAGTFDGNGYTISGLSRTNGSVTGFIGEGGAGLVIKNLTIDGTMSGVDHSAAFIGRANGAATIENCVNKVNVSGPHTVGGFVGITSSAVAISNSVNYGNITATSVTATDSYVGGFVGRANKDNPSAVNCANYGDITGLTGVANGILCLGVVTDSYNVGSVSNTNGKAAPITGWTSKTVTNCYFIADKISGAKVEMAYGTAKTQAQFESGEVTYLLNGSTAENATWGQELGVDTYPVYGKTDYPVYKFDYIYTNSSEPFGTESNPYLIGTEEELKAFRDLANKDGGSALCAKLTDDIEITDTWTSIAPTNSTPYTGTFDGNGYTISGLDKGRNDVFGFVGEGGEGLTFKNLTIEGTLERTDLIHTGGFVGRAKGAVTFINCVSNVDITGTELLGGFIGNPQTYAHSFTNCANYGNITNTVDASVGGFMGNVGSTAQTFVNCANYGAVNGTGGAVIAGVAANGKFTNCIGVGAVTNANGPATTTYNRYSSSGNNCYYLAGATTSTNNVDGGTSKTAAQFASGEVTYLINKNAMEIVCGQDLAADSYPIFGKDAMVWDNLGIYSNETGVFYAVDAESVILGATEGAIAYVAQYNGKRLVDTALITVTEELTENAIIPNAEATSCKVFLWDENIKPLCAYTEVAFAAN